MPGTGKTATITGHGMYDIGGEFAVMQRVQLDVATDGGLEQHFDSGLVPARGRGRGPDAPSSRGR